MINADSIRKMKKGVRLVNCARGELLNEAAVVEALQSGQLGGAALDVYSNEPLKDSPLMTLPNVMLTPHIAGSTNEAQEAVGVQIALQVREYLLRASSRTPSTCLRSARKSTSRCCPTSRWASGWELSWRNHAKAAWRRWS